MASSGSDKRSAYVLESSDDEGPAQTYHPKKVKEHSSPTSSHMGIHELDLFLKSLNKINEELEHISSFISGSGASKEVKKKGNSSVKKIKLILSDEVQFTFKSLAEKARIGDAINLIQDTVLENNIKINDNLKKLEEIKSLENRNVGQLTKSFAEALGPKKDSSSVIKVSGLKKPLSAPKTIKAKVQALPDERGVVDGGDSLRKKIMNKVDPKKYGFKPVRIYSVKDSSVIIEASDGTLDNLVKDLDLADALKVKISSMDKFNPKMSIFNVPSDIDAKDLANEIITQNDLPSSSYIVPSFKFGPRNKHFSHWVVEVNAATRKDLLAKSKLYLNWHSCNVEDRINLTKCFNCQGYGHTALKCNTEVACGICADKHETRSCPNRDDPSKIKCILCMRSKLEDVKHKPRDSKCISYRRRMEAYVANIDFGGSSAPLATDFMELVDDQ